MNYGEKEVGPISSGKIETVQQQLARRIIELDKQSVKLHRVEEILAQNPALSELLNLLREVGI